MIEPARWWHDYGMRAYRHFSLALVGALTSMACTEPAPAPFSLRCLPGATVGAPTQFAWSVEGPWSKPASSHIHALPDGGVVVVGWVASAEPDTAPALDVRAYSPDGELRWQELVDDYEGVEIDALGLAVSETGQTYLLAYAIHTIIPAEPGVSSEQKLGEPMIVAWDDAGERRFASQISPCGDVKPEGLAATEGDGVVFAERLLAEDRYCRTELSSTGELVASGTFPLSGIGGFSDLAMQWDGSVLAYGQPVEGDGVVLARYGELGWSHANSTDRSSRYWLEPGLSRDGITLVNYEEVGDGEVEDYYLQAGRAFNAEGELLWQYEGSILGQNCAGEVIVRGYGSGRLSLLDLAEGHTLEDFALPEQAASGAPQVLVPSPDGALYQLNQGSTLIRFQAAP